MLLQRFVMLNEWPMTLTKNISTKILNREFSAFDHFFNELIESKNDFEFFQLIADSIIPLIRSVDVYYSLHHTWIVQRQKYKKACLQIESDTKNELYGTFIQIKKILEKENLLQYQAIHKSLLAAEQVLDYSKKYIVPSYVEAAYRQLRSLLYDLLKLNQVEIVGHFAQVIFLDEAAVDEKTKGITYFKSPAIEHFTFAPSLTKLHHLHAQFSWDQINETWIAWEYLTLAEQCWKIDTASIQSHTYDGSENDSFYLNFHAFCSEMQAIKNGGDGQPFFFQRTRFIYYLKKIHQDLILYQEIHPKEEIEPFPYALSLELRFNQLILNIEWIKESESESYLVHKFNEESEPYRFTKNLLNSQPHTSLSLESAGASVAKFLQRIRLNSILANLFFTNRTSVSLALRSKCIKLSDYPDVNLKELRREIEPFEKVSAPKAMAWINTTKSGKTA